MSAQDRITQRSKTRRVLGSPTHDGLPVIAEVVGILDSGVFFLMDFVHSGKTANPTGTKALVRLERMRIV